MYRFAYTVLLLLALSLGMASCQNDGYDTGDSAYSYITAELVLLHTNSNKAVAYATLDDGSQLQFSNKFGLKWAEEADADYRALEQCRSTDADGKQHVVLEMYHNQGGVPQYYTVQQYVSVSLTELNADVVEIQANTYNGKKSWIVEK